MSRVAGKRAIVTGAAVGIGHAYVEALTRAGARVVMCDVRDEVLSFADQLRGQGHDVSAHIADVSNPDDVWRVVQHARTSLGGVDLLVSNAGVWGESKAGDDLDKTLADYERIVGTNLKGVYLFGRAVIPMMIEQGTPADIVNVATDHMVTCGTPHHVCPHLPDCPWGKSPRPTGGGPAMDLYDAAKWGINGFTFGWAKALAPHRIRVNALCMGATDSFMLRSFHGFDPSPEEEASWMKAEDAAQVLIDLLEEGPDGRTAQNMNFCVGRPCRLEDPLPNIYVRDEDLHGA